MKIFLLCLGCIILCNFLGSLPALTTIPELSNWYTTINKPSWQPPSWLFGPVWTILFTLMGIALYIINKNGFAKKENLVFGVQMVFNMLWTLLFFKWHLMGWALVEIVILLALIIFTIFIFYKKNKVAAYLLVPYVSWVSFATILNATIWYLNS